MLFHESHAPHMARTRTVFRRKGFSEPAECSLGAARLLLYPKQLNPVRNWFEAESGRRLCCTGTPVYKGLGYAQGMTELLKDWESRRVLRDELVGFYCLLFFDGSRVSLMTDSSGLYHIFSNADGTVISNSLQAVLVADGIRHPVDRDALTEQLLTGSVTGPDTLFKDIVLLTQEKQKEFRSPIADFMAIRPPPADPGARHSTFTECVEQQLTVLREYFHRIRALSGEMGLSLGVSGGYDSRLLLLLARDAGLSVSVYTYSSSKHARESSVAEELAKHAGIGLVHVPVRAWRELDYLARRVNMNDALYLWDGRTNMTMGSFNDVHAREVRIRALGSSGLSLNGLGGELYRNREHLRAGRIDFGEWLLYYVLTPDSVAALAGARDLTLLRDRLAVKYAAVLGRSARQLRHFDRSVARLLYRDVWLPYSAGPKLCAENAISFSLMPFADSEVSRSALGANPHIGYGGCFEAEMIRKIDPGLAKVNSCYGHSFDTVPMFKRVADCAISAIPERLRIAYGDMHFAIRRRLQSPALVDDLTRSALAWSIQLLVQFGLPILWDRLVLSPNHRDRILYLAYFFYVFSDSVEGLRVPDPPMVFQGASHL